MAWLLALGVASQAAFLESNQTALEAALGGNGVAQSGACEALSANPALAAWQETPTLAARYQSLYGGFSSDEAASAALGGVAKWGAAGLGLGWEHFGVSHLNEDRLRLVGALNAPHALALGVQLDWLRTGYSSGDAGLPTARRDAQALDFGAGAAWRPLDWLCLAASGSQLARPDLGILSEDRLEPIGRWGLAAQRTLDDGCALGATAAQSASEGRLETSGGLWWSHPLGFCLRLGAAAREVSAGFGVAVGDWALDYAYQWAAFGGDALPGGALPGSHVLELAWRPAVPSGDRAGKAAEFEAEGRRAEARGDEPAALAAYRRALEFASDDGAALAGLARLEAAAARRRAAMARAQALEADARGDSPAALAFWSALAAMDAGDTQASARREALKTALPRDWKGEASLLEGLRAAAALKAQGRREEAHAMAVSLAARAPQDPLPAALAQALEAPPTPAPTPTVAAAEPDPQVERLLREAEAYRLKGRPEMERQLLLKARSRDPRNEAVRRRLAEDGRAAKAADPAKRREAQSQFERGVQLYLAGDLKGAIRAWEKALEADPEHAEALNSLVRARMEQGGGK